MFNWQARGVSPTGAISYILLGVDNIRGVNFVGRLDMARIAANGVLGTQEAP